MSGNRRYSLTRYSVNQEDKSVEIMEAFSETLGALAGVAVPVDIRDRYSEICAGMVCGTVSVVSSFSGTEVLGVQARMSADVITGAALTEDFQTLAYAQKDIPAGLTLEEMLSAAPWASKDIPARMELKDYLSMQVAGSKDILGRLLASEVLTVITAAMSQTTQQAVFQVTIPPGGELRMDGELFTVLLNGENALHTQSGDWITISRELLTLSVESASGGGLEGQIIYTERFL